jgi:hypothetical protein
MSELQLKMLLEHFEKINRECDTPAKALSQLRDEGLVDEDGRTSALYSDPVH